MFTVNWGLFEHRVKSIINNMGRHRDTLDKEAAALHFQDMKEARERSERDAVEYEQRRQNSMVQEVIGWLGVDEDAQEELLHRLISARQSGTCEWILSKPGFLSWMDSQVGSTLVHLEGNPGSGKSRHLIKKIVPYGYREEFRLLTHNTAYSGTRSGYSGLLFLQSPYDW
jgi:hypothetical protein